MKVLVIVVAVALAAFFVGRYESGRAEGNPQPTIAPGSIATWTAPLGDADCSGWINSGDALAILRVIADGGLLPTQPANAAWCPVGVQFHVYVIGSQPLPGVPVP